MKEEQFLKFLEKIELSRAEIHKEIIGLDDHIDRLFTTFFADGNILAEGVPGIGKTLLFKTFPKVFNLKFTRIQFTPDVYPQDLLVSLGIMEEAVSIKDLKLKHGALFNTNILLADELNRAPEKTQSVFMEPTEEKQISYEGITFELSPPYILIATQNPIETEGTNRIAEALADRFMLKDDYHYPPAEVRKRYQCRVFPVFWPLI